MAWVGLVAVLGLGWFAFHRGSARPVQLTSDVEARAANALARAGHAWARLEVRGELGELHGEAPSEEARSAAYDAARQVLAPYMGVPGVFAQLDNRVRVRPAVAPPRAAAPGASAAAPVSPSPGVVTAAAVASGEVEPPRSCVDAVAAAARAAPVRFKPRSSEAPGAARPAARRLKQALVRCDGWRLVIEGHGDPGGARAANRRLQQRRAVAVASALLLEGVPVERLALQTDDARLRTPGAAARALPEGGDRISYQLVPQGAAAD